MNRRRVVWQFELDYVPWDTPDANEFGHGEPAMLIRLLDFARRRGLKFQFFASNRVLRAFPASAEAVLNDGHALDWLCKHPERLDEALSLFAPIGHRPTGFAVTKHETLPPDFAKFKFVSSPIPLDIESIPKFVPIVPALRDWIRLGGTVATWGDAAKSSLESPDELTIIAIRPQTLAKVDPKLTFFDEITQSAVDREPVTFASLT